MSRSIRNMFNDIATRYDSLNTILSLGIHHLWRKRTVKTVILPEGAKVLDCATGTADLAIAFSKYYGKKAKITGLDFSMKMLEIGQTKIRNNSKNIDLINGDILCLPFNDNIFDASTIAFGIRNVDNVKSGLAEMARVTKPGGKVLVLEFGQPLGIMFGLYKIYSKFWMPVVGKLLSIDKGAYTYLPATSLKFPCRDKFIDIMNETGMYEQTAYKTFTFGIAYLYVGVVKKI